MDLVATILFSIMFVSFVGIGVYTIAVPCYCLYDSSFEPSQRKGWKRVPRSIMILGYTSMVMFILCFFIGALLAIFFGK
jgi:hypothetical protein